jgi:hypothetical protein
MSDNFAGILGLLAPPIPPRADEPYFAALGRFIAAYATAEHQVHLLARHLTRLNDAKGRIIFSNMRLGDLSERIRGLLRATKANQRRYNEADICLQQLDRIATQRNNLVHRFVKYHNSRILVTNVVIAKSIETAEEQVFTKTDFENMDLDCTAITLRLRLLCGGREAKPNIRKWAREPWRYKPPQPTRKQKRHPSTPRSRKRQPRASEG